MTQDEVEKRRERDEQKRFMKIKERMEAMANKTAQMEVKKHGNGQ